MSAVKRFKVRAKLNPPEIGWTECRDWDRDEWQANRLAQRMARDPRYTDVELVSMERLPSGRWSRFCKTPITLKEAA